MAPVIEVSIGLILVYTLLSIIVSAIHEGLAGLFGWRAAYLQKGIQSLLGPAMTGQFFKHSLIRALKNDDAKLKSKKMPSYVSASTFTETVLDIVRQLDPPPGSDRPANSLDVSSKDAVLQDLRSRLPSEPLPTANEDPANMPAPILPALRVFSTAAKDLSEFKKRVDGWYEETMDRVRGWYTRFTRVILLIIGAVLVILINGDSINIATTLWREAPIRAAVVEQAGTVAAEEQPDTEEAVDQLRDLEELNLPLGWAIEDAGEGDPRGLPDTFLEVLTKLLGLLITALALSFGSTFWFDFLKRFVGIRSSGPEPQPAQTGPPSGAAEQPLRLNVVGRDNPPEEPT